MQIIVVFANTVVIRCQKMINYSPHNKALHLTAIPLCSIVSGEIGRWGD